MDFCGQEERHLHEQLTSLESQAFQDVQAMSTLGAPETRPQATELLARVKNTMHLIRGSIRKLELLGEEQDTEVATHQVQKLIQNHKKQYEGLKRNLVGAHIQMKKNAEKAWLNQREQLLAGATEPNHTVQSQQQAVKASQKITESLRRTHEQMTQQIELTDGNLEVLGASTQELVKAKGELQSQEEKFSTAGRLLNSMQRQDTWDKMALWGGVIIFSMAVLFIFQKRVLGLTPDVVKSSVTNVVSSSFSTLYDLGKSAMKSDSSGKDPAEIPNLFDDLEDDHDPGDKIGVAPDMCGSGQVMVDGACAWVHELEEDVDATAGNEPKEGRHTADEVREELRKLKEKDGGTEENEESEGVREDPSILKDLEALSVDEAPDTQDIANVDQGTDVDGVASPQVETEDEVVISDASEMIQEHPQNEMGDSTADPAHPSGDSPPEPPGVDPTSTASADTEDKDDDDDEYEYGDEDEAGAEAEAEAGAGAGAEAEAGAGAGAEAEAEAEAEAGAEAQADDHDHDHDHDDVGHGAPVDGVAREAPGNEPPVQAEETTNAHDVLATPDIEPHDAEASEGGELDSMKEAIGDFDMVDEESAGAQAEADSGENYEGDVEHHEKSEDDDEHLEEQQEQDSSGLTDEEHSEHHQASTQEQDGAGETAEEHSEEASRQLHEEDEDDYLDEEEDAPDEADVKDEL